MIYLQIAAIVMGLASIVLSVTQIVSRKKTQRLLRRSASLRDSCKKQFR